MIWAKKPILPKIFFGHLYIISKAVKQFSSKTTVSFMLVLTSLGRPPPYLNCLHQEADHSHLGRYSGGGEEAFLR